MAEKEDLREIFSTLSPDEMTILKEVLRQHVDRDHLTGKILTDEISNYVKKVIK